jgi:hypothetical protein
MERVGVFGIRLDRPMRADLGLQMPPGFEMQELGGTKASRSARGKATRSCLIYSGCSLVFARFIGGFRAGSVSSHR